LKKDRSTSLSKKHAKQNKTKEQLEKLDEQIQQLRLEISKHKQNEVHLEQQVTELKVANKKLQSKTPVKHQVGQSNRILRGKTDKVRVPKELREQPLDVDKLKSMAELARQIRGRPRQ
jgi:chromosome segregation ATPase